MNPILQMLQQKPMNNMMSLISAVKGNPEGMFNSMMQNNPQFRKFIKDNEGKSIQDIAMQYGIDINTLNNLLK